MSSELKKIFLLLSPYKFQVIIIFIFVILTSVCSIFIPLLSKDIMDKGFIGQDYSLLIKLILVSFTIGFLDQIFSLIMAKIRLSIYVDLVYKLTDKAIQKINKLSMSFLDRRNNAEVMNVIGTDIGKLSTIADDRFLFIFGQIFNFIGGTIGLLLISPVLTLLVLGFIPIKYFTTSFFSKKQEYLTSELLESHREYAKFLGEYISTIKDIRIFNLVPYKYASWSEYQKKILHIQQKYEMTILYNTTLDSIMFQILTSLIYIIGANMVFNLSLSIGAIFAFVTYSSFVAFPITSILNLRLTLASILPSAKRFYDFLELEEECENNSQTQMVEEVQSIKFSNITFGYGQHLVLKDISFNIKQKEKIAIVGLNGAGKSTIFDLLLRFYKVNSGNITINKQSIYEIPISEYREFFSVVSQDVYLFNDSIRNNIILHKQISDEQIYSIASQAGVASLFDTLSLDYIVGNNGVMLSGGQKQKIALLRALLQDRPIIIFDEATSNNDNISDAEFNKLFNSLLQEKTVILSTHKTPVLKEMDQVILLDNGKISGIGSYKKLLDNELFNKIISIQKELNAVQ